MPKLVPQTHEALHTIAEEITSEDFESGYVTKLIKKMREALKEYNVDGFVAVAIAAPQVGVSKRLFIVSDQSTDREKAMPSFVAINPKIVKSSKKTHFVGEGCLSVRDHYGEVKRATNVTMRALDENGKQFERGAGGLLAQIIQHETDHLDGILFVDRAEQVWDKEEMKGKNLSEAE
ncbi:MAG: peptide deformylase [Candidatus Azotimanducaceae bacterium]|jgi:peptide deformylase